MIRIIRYSLLLLVLQFKVVAKSYLYDNRQGLSNNIVTCIVKDKQGLLWVGTPKGLNTFDGYSFNIIPGTENVAIHSLQYDSIAGQIWIASSSGLFVINEDQSSLINCTFNIRDNYIKEILQYHQYKFVVFQDGRVLSISPEFSCRFIQNTQHGANGGSVKIKRVVTDGNGYAYITYESLPDVEVMHLPTGKSFIHPFFKNKGIWGLYSGNGSCMVNTGTNLVPFVNVATTNLESSSIRLPENRNGVDLTCIRQYGSRYFVAYRGICDVYEIDTINKRFELIETKSDELFTRTKSIESLYADGENILWIGTNKGLIKHVVSPHYAFERILHDYPNMLSIRQISKLPNGDLVIGTYSGVYTYSPEGGVKQLSNQIMRCGMVIPPYLYAGDEAAKIPFFRINYLTGKKDFSFYLLDTISSSIRSIFSMCSTPDGMIWLATDRGLATYSPQTRFLVLHHADSLSLGSGPLMSVIPNTDSTQLIATGKNGVSFINLRNLSVTRFNPTSHPEMPDDLYWYAGLHPNGSYWFGTQKSGMVTLSADCKTINVFDTKDGLSNNEVYSVVWVNNNEAWITTALGLNRFNLNKQTFDTYYYEDGIADDEFNQNSIFFDNGKIYAGGIDGITLFTPSKIELRNTQPRIFCAGISKWGNTTGQVHVTDDLKVIEIGPQEYLLKFIFGLSDYNNTESNTYYYRIKNLHNSWRSLGTSNVLNLEGLNEGEYELSVIGMNKYGNKSVNTLQFNLVVIPVYYKTYWFYGVLIIVLIGLGMLYFRWRINQVNQRHMLRTKISSNLHDEVGSLLTSIIISTDNARYSSVGVEEKNKKLKRIADLSREATNTMSDVLWSIDARNDYAGSFTDRMQEHAVSIFNDTGIEVRFDLSESNQNQVMGLETRQQLYLIFKEALNNVLKHGATPGFANVKYAQNGVHFDLVIENEMSESLKSTGPTGQGILNMEMRAQKIGAKFKAETPTDNLFRIKVSR